MSNGKPPIIQEARQLPPPQAAHRSASYQAWLFRGLILAVILGSLALIWWSFALVLSPRQTQSRELSLEVTHLSAEVDDLDRQWTKAQMAQVTNQFNQVDFTLFEGRAGVETWLANLKELAASLALNLGADVGQPTQQTVGGRTLTLIPATVSIEVLPAGPEIKPSSPYKRVLLLGQSLLGESKRADLTELTVAGGTNSISQVVLVLNYWTGKGSVP
jgi:hypothetical protein